MYSSNPIFTGAAMGLSIAVLDMVLRPRLATGVAQLFLFFVEGTSCYIVYKSMTTDKRGDTYKLDSTLVHSSVLSGLVIWVTDFFVKPGLLGQGQEFIKFLIQGMIVYYVLGMVNTPAAGSGSGSSDSSY